MKIEKGSRGGSVHPLELPLNLPMQRDREKQREIERQTDGPINIWIEDIALGQGTCRNNRQIELQLKSIRGLAPRTRKAS